MYSLNYAILYNMFEKFKPPSPKVYYFYRQHHRPITSKKYRSNRGTQFSATALFIYIPRCRAGDRKIAHNPRALLVSSSAARERRVVSRNLSPQDDKKKKKTSKHTPYIHRARAQKVRIVHKKAAPARARARALFRSSRYTAPLMRADVGEYIIARARMRGITRGEAAADSTHIISNANGYPRMRRAQAETCAMWRNSRACFPRFV